MLQRNTLLPSESIHDSGVGSPSTMLSRLTFCAGGRAARERRVGKTLAASGRVSVGLGVATRTQSTRLVLEAGVVVRAPVSCFAALRRHSCSLGPRGWKPRGCRARALPAPAGGATARAFGGWSAREAVPAAAPAGRRPTSASVAIGTSVSRRRAPAAFRDAVEAAWAVVTQRGDAGAAGALQRRRTR